MKYILAPILLIAIVLLMALSLVSSTFKFLEDQLAEFIDYLLKKI